METLETLLPLLREYRSVLVTGAQRSGTTIAAHILSNALGLEYADEEKIDIHSYQLALKAVTLERVVLQAPGLMHVADLLSRVDSLAVVIMRRDVAEIKASEDRISWREAFAGANIKMEQLKYLDRFGVTPGSMPIAEVKYFCWDTYQKPRCGTNVYDLQYESLKGHPLWKDKSMRQEYTSRQWE